MCAGPVEHRLAESRAVIPEHRSESVPEGERGWAGERGDHAAEEEPIGAKRLFVVRHVVPQIVTDPLK